MCCARPAKGKALEMKPYEEVRAEARKLGFLYDVED